ncbi:hypothetical protein [Amycolatopsis sp. DG1A-15b]|uniref:hypothetical protein n=1 Tax=Amycolatopsis sp. DG1A-15b TaxID=3052846 RepID=UPI00255B93B1|nr:hypothetical protein [Amycolatopsis sp. DG1A-15b]WIX85513.1 hypothetical protein QRY02_30315 [Amycolatopsis sp. DG1A-15b]
MVYLVPPRRPKRSCGALSALEALTFTAAMIGVIVLERLGSDLLVAAGVVITLLALVRGVPLPRPRSSAAGVIA